MLLGIGDINALAQQIVKIEGYIPPNTQYPQGSLAYQNNNPGNLRFANQPGAVQGAGGFAKFSSYDAGYQALLNQIQLQAARGQTLEQFINQYAPPTENNTSAYLSSLERATGYGASDPLTSVISGAAPNTSPSSSEIGIGPLDGYELVGSGGNASSENSDSLGLDTMDASMFDMSPTALIVGTAFGILALALFRK